MVFAADLCHIGFHREVPYSSELSSGKNKFGFFASERRITAALLVILASGVSKTIRYAPVTHWFIWWKLLMIYAAVMDIEDAHKLHLITTDRAIELFLGFFEGERRKRRRDSYDGSDLNEQIAYLRTSVIGLLISAHQSSLQTRDPFRQF